MAPTLRHFAARCPPRGRIFLGAARRKIGYAPRSAAIDRYRTMLSAPGSALTASMLRDLDNGGPIAADHIVGYMLEKVRMHGVDEGMLAMAYAYLEVYEVRQCHSAKSSDLQGGRRVGETIAALDG